MAARPDGRRGQAFDVEKLRGSNLLSGRALDDDKIARLFATCTADPSPEGTRDAALLAVFYGGGLRRGELARLDVAERLPHHEPLTEFS